MPWNNTEEDVEIVAPKTNQGHANCQNMKRANRYGGTNSHMPFSDDRSSIVEVGRNRRDLIQHVIAAIPHPCMSLEKQNLRRKTGTDGRVPTPLAANEAAKRGRGGGPMQRLGFRDLVMIPRVVCIPKEAEECYRIQR